MLHYENVFCHFAFWLQNTCMNAFLPNQKYELQSEFRQTKVSASGKTIITSLLLINNPIKPSPTYYGLLLGHFEGKFIAASKLVTCMVRNAL